MIDANVAGAVFRGGRYFLRRALGGNRQPLTDVARKTTVICDGHAMRAVTPFFDIAHVPRIRNTQHYTAREIVCDHLHRRSIEFRPVRIHWVEDAWIIDGSVFVAGTTRIDLRDALEKRSLLRRYSLAPEAPYAEIQSGVLSGITAGSTWFGHWLEDEVPLLMLACAHGQPVTHMRQEFVHEAAYRDALRLPAPARLSVARIQNLALVDEFAQNPNKTLRYALMRKRLARYPRGSDRIFLYRGASGTPRNLVNERELADRLEGKGFVTVDIGSATLGDLLQHCRGASIVVSVEGSHLAHALFMMRDHGAMLILCPPNQVHTTVADIGVFCRLHSGIFVCSDRSVPGGAGFFADPEEVSRFIDALLSHAERKKSDLGAYVDEVIALAGAGDQTATWHNEASSVALPMAS